MSPMPTERWARVLGAAAVDSEEVGARHEIPDAIGRLVARTGADPEMLARAADEALRVGHAVGDGAFAVASGAGVCLVVTRAPQAALGERAIAHEMANALTSIAGWARLVREASDGARRARLSALDAAVADALETARAVLDGRLGAPSELDLGDVARRVASGLEPLAHAAGVRLEVDAPLSVRLERSPVAVRAIVQNLLKNAIEASPRGGSVVIKVDRARRAARVAVLDRGPGLGGPRRQGGHGVGLGVVERMAGEMRAVVRFAPRAGGGTEAMVTFRSDSAQLPAADRARRPTPRVVRAAVPTPRGTPSIVAVKRSGERVRRKRVLVVEDEPSLSEMIRSALLMIDAEVTCVATAGDVALLDTALRFDVALVDLRLENGDPESGLDVLALIVRRALAARVVLTSGAPPEALPHGVDALLPKPFDLDGLLSAIVPALELEHRARTRA